MYYLLQFIYAGFAAATFSLIFNGPKKLFLYYFLIGGSGWTVSLVAQDYGLNSFSATFAGSFLIGVMSSISAIVLKYPTITFYLPGFIPLVPGAGLYRSWMSLIIEDTVGFTENMLDTTLVAFGIAVGIFFATNLIEYIYRNINLYIKKPDGN